jgi:putative ATP-dependent endonuclease of OLD family
LEIAMSLFARWRARLARFFTSRLFLSTIRDRCLSSQGNLRLLLVVEGVHDIEFLRRISAMLHAHESELPDLGAMEHRGELIFLPGGGAEMKLWTHRLGPLGKPECHVYDREESPETELRRQLAEAVNRRPGCFAVLTSKRNLECYLHSDAIREAGGVEVVFGDDDSVADLIARQIYVKESPGVPWEELPRRNQTRRRNRVKRWLNTKAVDRMTPQRLAERDPKGEVRSWLEAMMRLADVGR